MCVRLLGVHRQHVTGDLAVLLAVVHNVESVGGRLRPDLHPWEVLLQQVLGGSCQCDFFKVVYIVNLRKKRLTYLNCYITTQFDTLGSLHIIVNLFHIDLIPCT